MKNVKKVLALILAMTMMFGVVSVCASAAADTTSASFGVAFKDADGKDITEAKVGDIVDVYLSIKTNGYTAVFALLSCYDATALTHVKENATATGAAPTAKNAAEVLGRFGSDAAVEDEALIAHEAEKGGENATGEVLDWGTGSLTITPHKAAMYPSTWGDAEKAQYKCINLGYLAASDYSNLTVNTKGEFAELVRYRFICIKDTALNSSVFFKSPDAKKSYISIDPDDEPLANYQVSAPVDVANLTIEYPAGGSAGGDDTTTPVVSNAETQVRWHDKNAGILDIGFCGSVSDLTPVLDADGKTVTNVAKIGFIFSRTDASLATGTEVEAHTLYDFTSETAGTYKFRAVVTGEDLSYDSEAKLYACAFIQIGNDKILATNAKIDTTINAEYLDAVNNHKMPAFGK